MRRQSGFGIVHELVVQWLVGNIDFVIPIVKAQKDFVAVTATTGRLPTAKLLNCTGVNAYGLVHMVKNSGTVDDSGVFENTCELFDQLQHYKRWSFGSNLNSLKWLLRCGLLSGLKILYKESSKVIANKQEMGPQSVFTNFHIPDVLRMTALLKWKFKLSSTELWSMRDDTGTILILILLQWTANGDAQFDCVLAPIQVCLTKAVVPLHDAYLVFESAAMSAYHTGTGEGHGLVCWRACELKQLASNFDGQFKGILVDIHGKVEIVNEEATEIFVTKMEAFISVLKFTQVVRLYIEVIVHSTGGIDLVEKPATTQPQGGQLNGLPSRRTLWAQQINCLFLLGFLIRHKWRSREVLFIDRKVETPITPTTAIGVVWEDYFELQLYTQTHSSHNHTSTTRSTPNSSDGKAKVEGRTGLRLQQYMQIPLELTNSHPLALPRVILRYWVNSYVSRLQGETTTVFQDATLKDSPTDLCVFLSFILEDKDVPKGMVFVMSQA